jgi:RNA polymerase sigma-70 factor (ECF subfamily)
LFLSLTRELWQADRQRKIPEACLIIQPMADTEFSQLTDELLLRPIKKENHEAFTVLVKRHSTRFYRIAYRFVYNKEDAEDIVQEAFIRLWEKPEIWDENKKAQFTTWFYKIVINLCFDHKKKKEQESLPEDLQLADKQPGLDVVMTQEQKQMLMNKFIRQLPKSQQTALNLCFYEGVSNKEAAEIMGLKIKALQSLIMRAKTNLKKKISHYK